MDSDFRFDELVIGNNGEEDDAEEDTSLEAPTEMVDVFDVIVLDFELSSKLSVLQK